MSKEIGFDSYEEASKRAVIVLQEVNNHFNIASFRNLWPVIRSSIAMLASVTSTFALIPAIVAAALDTSCPLYTQLASLAAINVINDYFCVSTHLRRCHARPGLYLCEQTESNSQKLLKNCPLLASPVAVEGGLEGIASATPWAVTGDMRTFFPFVLFSSPIPRYTRRWIRVPLSKGTLDYQSMNKHEDEFEAVALDISKSTVSDGRDKHIVYLILAGLTGGSTEGYITDLVNTANDLGSDCYVMIGRGLCDTPCASGVLFHGARTCDVAACASEIRKQIPPQSTLILVGISLGGIITINAVARSKIKGVDGAVSIGGSFETSKNIEYPRSRLLWQPLLAFGLKSAFVSPIATFQQLSEHFGGYKDTIKAIEHIKDILDFDSVVVATVHNFNNVLHYYRDMCGASTNILESQINANKAKGQQTTNKDTSKDTSKDTIFTLDIPLLAIHAQDDPIISVETTTPRHLVKQIDNFISLITTTGGHIGWPLGIFPWLFRFKFQNSLIVEFSRAVRHLSLTKLKEIN